MFAIVLYLKISEKQNFFKGVPMKFVTKSLYSLSLFLGLVACAHAMQTASSLAQKTVSNVLLASIEREIKSLREFYATMAFIKAFEKEKLPLALFALRNGANKTEAIKFMRLQDSEGEQLSDAEFIDQNLEELAKSKADLESHRDDSDDDRRETMEFFGIISNSIELLRFLKS